MEIGMCGLGRMGGNMARRLSRGGIRVAALDRTLETAEKLAAEEAAIVSCRDVDDLAAKLSAPRVVWLMP